jgi:hypothetical protein
MGLPRIMIRPMSLPRWSTDMLYRPGVRLTLGIPTQGMRPDRLMKAVGSALAQSVPVRVVVSDQSGDDTVKEILEPYKDHPHVAVIESPATCLWENWVHAFKSCDTDLFGWLQDDDVISPHLASRAIKALDRQPKANLWIARLGTAMTDGLANWWQATGPLVPMDLLYGGETQVYGHLLAPISFFSSFALSPGLVFRNTLANVQAVEDCPTDADLFNERLVLAHLGKHGNCVCDPAIVGYWNQHESNTSRSQIEAGDVKRQISRLVEEASKLVREAEDWREPLRGWAVIAGRDVIGKIIQDTKDFPSSPEFDEALGILKDAYGDAIRTAESKVEEDGVESRPLPIVPEKALNRKARRAAQAIAIHET